MLPAHLKRYVVQQDYGRYTPLDQEVWRYIMRQLKAYLSVHAHPCYVDGLKKTGIEVDRIPEIEKMSEKLQKFGWQAVPVSGFIPPAAFMELQAHGFLPIASDMRSIDHLTYTPAPDIVHEAAGHAPILIEPGFAGYLKSYAQVAKKAIISHEDMAQYEAIRDLSDLKENPHSTPDEIKAAEARLNEVNAAITEPSEAAILGRMNWWTAEYGLIGSLENPKIFGAGLLSSVGEATACLNPKVKKLPFTLDCINYTYDITEQQPQLFVTPEFSRLGEVLEELANLMAFRRGGAEGLAKAKKARTVNTVVMNSGLQISGRLKDFAVDGREPAYLQFDGPTQLSYGDKELPGHSTTYHAQGFGSPVGLLEETDRCLSELSDESLGRLGIRVGAKADLRFKTGAHVQGTVTGWTRSPEGRLLLITFKDCRVTRDGQLMFDPAWGTYDMAVGCRVTSVFGGPADRPAYGESDDFVAKVVPRKQWPALIQEKHRLYQEVRDVRAELEKGLTTDKAEARLNAVLQRANEQFPDEWLLKLDVYELTERLPSVSWKPKIETELQDLSRRDAEVRARIDDGIRVMRA